MYIVAYTLKAYEFGFPRHYDNYLSFENFQDAHMAYMEILQEQELFSASLAAVFTSSDYETAKELKEYVISSDGELVRSGETA